MLQVEHPSQVRADVWRVRGGISAAVAAARAVAATSPLAVSARAVAATSAVAASTVASTPTASVRGCKGHELV